MVEILNTISMSLSKGSFEGLKKCKLEFEKAISIDATFQASATTGRFTPTCLGLGVVEQQHYPERVFTLLSPPLLRLGLCRSSSVALRCSFREVTILEQQ